MKIVLEKQFALGVDAFVSIFLSDHAKFSLMEFNRRQGATEIEWSEWKEVKEEIENDVDHYKMQEITDDLLDSETEKINRNQKYDQSRKKERKLTFRVPIEAPIGPKSSQVHILQYLISSSLTGNKTKVIHSKTQLMDIPYGDHFIVEDHWNIIYISEESCKLSIELDVIFIKSTLWKSTIETRAYSDYTKKFETWAKLANLFLSPSGIPSLLSQNKNNNSDLTTSQKKKLSIKSSPLKSNLLNKTKSIHTNDHFRSQNIAQIALSKSKASLLLMWSLLFLFIYFFYQLQNQLAQIDKRLLEMEKKMDKLFINST